MDWSKLTDCDEKKVFIGNMPKYLKKNQLIDLLNEKNIIFSNLTHLKAKPSSKSSMWLITVASYSHFLYVHKSLDNLKFKNKKITVSEFIP